MTRTLNIPCQRLGKLCRSVFFSLHVFR